LVHGLANPAVTIARSYIRWYRAIGGPMFVVAQFAGMLAALLVTQWLWRPAIR
jgi:glycerol uptake facilitator-like aquaporin